MTKKIMAIKNALDTLYERVKKSGEVESAISNIKVIRGDEEDGDELDLASEKVSAKDAPFVKLVNLILTVNFLTTKNQITYTLTFILLNNVPKAITVFRIVSL